MKYIHMIKWFLLFPFFLLFVVISLMSTERGFQLIVELTDSLSGDVFSVGRVEGRLWSAWRLEGVEIQIKKNKHEVETEKNRITVEIDELVFAWRAVEIFRGTLWGEYMKIRGVRVWFAGQEGKRDGLQRSRQYDLPEINLPINLIMDDFRLYDLSVFSSSRGDGYGEPFIINELLVKAGMVDGQLRVERFNLESPDFGGEFSGDIQFMDNWPLTLAGDWFVVAAGSDELTGRIDLKGDLEQLTVSLLLKTPFTAEISGGAGGMLADNLHWYFSGNTGEIVLNDLGVELPVSAFIEISEVSGSLQTYKGVLSAEVNYFDYPSILVETSFAGDLSGLEISFLRLLVDQSVLSATGRADWRDGVSWQGNLKGEQINPGLFLAEWPGKIDFELNTGGKWHNENLSADLQIELLDGVLRDFPLAGSGNMNLGGGELKFDNLLLQSGTTSLHIHGQAGHEFDLSFQAESEDMVSLHPESRGSFMVEGKVYGTRDAPRISFDLSGKELSFKEYSVEKIEAEVDADIGGNGEVKAEIRGRGFGGGGYYLDQVRVELAGNRENHTLILSAIAGLGELDLSFAGGLKDEQWLGEINRLQFFSQRFGRWQSGPAAVLRIARQQAQISGFSLRHEDTLVSLDGGWGKEKGWHISTELKDFSLQLLEEWDFSVPRFKGMVTAELTAGGKGAVPDKVELVVSLPDLVLIGEDEDGKVKKWTWPENSIGISIDDGEAIITALSRFEDGSKGQLDVVVKNIDFSNYQPEEITLSGNLKAIIPDISFITPLSNYMVEGMGGFGGGAEISGTLAVPIVRGEFSLADGKIFVPVANIYLDSLELSLTGDGRNNIVNISATSGEGKISMSGKVNLTDDKQLQVDIGVSGERFKVVNLAEYQVEISPDLRLLYNYKEGIFLSGMVTVPMAYIAPQEFQRVVAASADVVVIDYDGQKQQDNKNDLPLSFNIDVIMGEDVAIDAFGLQGKLVGRLEVAGSTGKAVTALGNLNLEEGIFIFSDATLEISRGLIFYQGGAVNNPGLDIRAEREVSGKEVGVLITGTTSRMAFNLFSNPAMDNSDILSYMMTGRSVAAGGGVEGAMLKAAAINLGKKLPGGMVTDGFEGITGFDLRLAGGTGDSGLVIMVGREIIDGLHISYGQNLSDSIGTFKARYDLNWGFSLETETSAEETGVDLFWSWEQ